jgi:hypothetical protein
MGESLIQQCRVCDEGFRVVKHFYQGRNGSSQYLELLTVPEE